MTNTLIVIIILLSIVVILSTFFFIKFQEQDCDIEKDKEEEKNEVKEYKVHVDGEKEVYNISPIFLHTMKLRQFAKLKIHQLLLRH